MLKKMNAEEFRKFGKAAVDFIADYFDNIRSKKVLSLVEPGFMKCMLPQEAPYSGEQWQDVLQDVDRIITPGLTHWHSPNFHAYYPTANSYPGIVGELFLSGLGVISNDWFSNPACVELEVRMMDWLGKIIGLPEEFLNHSEGQGGGVIQNAASESTLVGLLSGKNRVLKQSQHSKLCQNKLVAYTSEQSNSSVEKAGLLASVLMKLLPTDQEGCLRGHTLLEAILKDKAQGLTPCCVIATLGTTGTCAFDKLNEIGPVCQKYGIWLHVDAAYAGSAFACPEYRHFMSGVGYADSFNINPHKWMLVNSDCSAMWFKNVKYVESLFKSSGANVPGIPNIQNWQIPNCRRFRALKLWFVLRIYGVEGIQKHIRQQIGLAEYFENLVRVDARFEICTSNMGLVCFRVRGKDALTQQVLDRVTQRRNIFIMPYYYQGKLVIRFVICSRFTEKSDIMYAWNEIREQTDLVIFPHCKERETEYNNAFTVRKNEKLVDIFYHDS